MKEEIKILLLTLLQKLPFWGYIIRLYSFLRSPDFDESPSTETDLRYSLLDVFSGLGLAATIIGFLILEDPSKSYLNIITAINPVYVVASYFYYSVIFSFACSVLIYCLSLTPLTFHRYNGKRLFLNVFLHCLRFYAAQGLFLGVLFITVLGYLIDKGIPPDVSLKGWFWLVYIVVTLVWFPIRLLINPLRKFARFKRFELLLGFPIIVMVLYSALVANQLVPMFFKDDILYNDKVCNLMKNGQFYKKLPEESRNKVLQPYCMSQ
ncbi:hypothetical protein [Idiomarina loihiensis]|uniref:hypothetical protein n=1 Tax=Idiomarina loihiensis TaxID=135577 RepID=UPI003850D735